jgi:hypothetical protein
MQRPAPPTERLTAEFPDAQGIRRRASARRCFCRRDPSGHDGRDCVDEKFHKIHVHVTPRRALRRYARSEGGGLWPHPRKWVGVRSLDHSGRVFGRAAGLSQNPDGFAQMDVSRCSIRLPEGEPERA